MKLYSCNGFKHIFVEFDYLDILFINHKTENSFMKDGMILLLNYLKCINIDS